jgi:DNA-binding transcriptional regulator YhcF (GntR family)
MGATKQGVPIVRNSGYKKVVDDITERIAAGQLAEGDKMPTVREMASQHGVHPSTVERAIPVLDDRGLIRGRAGSARWVAKGAQQRARERLERDARTAAGNDDSD